MTENEEFQPKFERNMFKISVTLYTCADQNRTSGVNRLAPIRFLNEILKRNYASSEFKKSGSVRHVCQNDGSNSKTLYGVTAQNVSWDVNYIYNRQDGNNDTLAATIYYEKPDGNGETEKHYEFKQGDYNLNVFFKNHLGDKGDIKGDLESAEDISLQQRFLDVAEKSSKFNSKKMSFKKIESDQLLIGIPGCSADIVNAAITEPARKDDPFQRYLICCSSSRNRENTLNFAKNNIEHPITIMDNNEMIPSLKNLRMHHKVSMYNPMIPCQSKVDLCLQAVYNGITVLAEKPFLCTAPEIKEFMNVYNNFEIHNSKFGVEVTKGKILVGQHSICHPSYRQMLSYIKNYGKDVSNITYIFSWPKIQGSSITKENRCYDVNGGGPMVDLGVYAVSFFHFILGDDYNFDSVININSKKVLELDNVPLEVQIDADVLYVNSKDNNKNVSARLDVSFEPNMDGKSQAIIELVDGSKIYIKDPCHPQKTPDKSKWLSHMDKDGNAIEVQACHGMSRQSYGCQLDSLWDVVVDGKEIPSWMNLEAAYKNAVVMDAILNKVGVKKCSGKITYDLFKKYCEIESDKKKKRGLGSKK